jgi:hypothetical protein
MKTALPLMLSAISLLIQVLFSPAAYARVSRLQITSREVVANGIPFGEAGPYEKIRGTVHFEVNPEDPRNRQVFDLEKAPRDANGMVVFSADMFILHPVDPSRGNGKLFFEVNNRGNKNSFILLNDVALSANRNNPSTSEDLGNGFLLRQGYTLAWVGWSPAIAAGNNRLTVDFPIAMHSGEPLAERVLTEFSDANFGGQTVYTLPLSGSTTMKSYEAVSLDRHFARAELRVRPSDSPRPSAPWIPPGELLSPNQWSFANCPKGPPGTPSTTDICLAGGFRQDMVYELQYKATKSPVSGLAYITTRDFVSFLRHAAGDTEGTKNPAGVIKKVLCFGISISGQYLRDFLYQGFNEDEQGAGVCDGAFIHVAGAHKLPLNYRFARDPSGPALWGQHVGRDAPDVNFPRSYGVRKDSITGVEAGLLMRPGTDPKVMHTVSSTEYWQRRASLVDTDDNGLTDIAQPDSVREYLLAGTEHFHPVPGVGRGTLDRQFQQLDNLTPPGPILRALLVALDRWVSDGIVPPDSRVPRIADGTLIPPEQYCNQFPNIPGVVCNGLYNSSGERNFGRRVSGNRGVIDKLHPDFLSIHRVLVPQVDRFGIDLAGVRHPFAQAPVATLTGWNLRQPEFTDGDLADLSGMTVPLQTTREDRLGIGDPRPSLQELYGDHQGYVAAVRDAAHRLLQDGFLLPEDEQRIVQEADSSKLLKK